MVDMVGSIVYNTCITNRNTTGVNEMTKKMIYRHEAGKCYNSRLDVVSFESESGEQPNANFSKCVYNNSNTMRGGKKVYVSDCGKYEEVIIFQWGGDTGSTTTTIYLLEAAQ